MLFSLSVPSKTFLLGEYITLTGGPALVLNTEPRFQLLVDYQRTSNEVSYHGIHAASPAGKFIAYNAKQLQGYELTFVDPHQGKGGFGASGAQFALSAMLYTLTCHTSEGWYPESPAKNWMPACAGMTENLLKTYQQFATDGIGIVPSGADVVAQLQGKITYFYRAKNILEAFAWPFADLDFCLLRTGNKVATHLNLQQLPVAVNNNWSKIALAGINSVNNKDVTGFAQAIQQYGQAMQQQNLVLPETQNLLQLIATRTEVVAAKGCGALGADVIFVLLQKSRSRYFKAWAQKHGLDIVLSGNKISEGFRVESVV